MKPVSYRCLLEFIPVKTWTEAMRSAEINDATFSGISHAVQSKAMRGKVKTRSLKMEEIGMQRRMIMLNRIDRMRISIFAAASIVLFLVVGCTTIAVHMGSPYDRYDHNRTRAIITPIDTGSKETVTRVLGDEAYRPSGSDYFPRAKFAESDISTDTLPAANVVPLFTGVPLPLSSIPVKDERSDRDDLIDFLAEGPDAQVGVQPGDTMGDTKSTQIAYAPVLEFLGSSERLSGGRNQVVRRLSGINVVFADEVVDSRYRLRAFADVLAFRFEKFWFILYQLPHNDRYSRLVVVPERGKAQDFPAKKPY